jgi:hypothetical protein
MMLVGCEGTQSSRTPRVPPVEGEFEGLQPLKFSIRGGGGGGRRPPPPHTPPVHESERLVAHCNEQNAPIPLNVYDMFGFAEHV